MKFILYLTFIYSTFCLAIGGRLITRSLRQTKEAEGEESQERAKKGFRRRILKWCAFTMPFTLLLFFINETTFLENFPIFVCLNIGLFFTWVLVEGQLSFRPDEKI